MKKFSQGFTTGIAAATGIFAGAVLALKKTVVEPIENKAQSFEDNRKKANRKSHSAHKS